MEFTKDTSKVLAAIYKTYLERIETGESIDSAICFDSDFYKNVSGISSWPDSKVAHSLEQLRKTGFIKKDVIGGYEIQDSLIAYMENRFKNNVKELADFISNFIP